MESSKNRALNDGPFRLGVATMMQLFHHLEFTEDLAALIRRDGGAKRAVRALRREFLGEVVDEDYDTITIPEDATAEGIIAEAMIAFKTASIPFTEFDETTISLIYCDLKLVKGKTLQVFTYNFSRLWTAPEGCEVQ